MPKLTLLLGRKTIQVYDIDQEKLVVGRDPEADVVIDNPSVSRNHAEIRREGDGWVLEDLGSSNGTFLHGDRIQSAVGLEPGDEIGFGKFSLVFKKAVGQGDAPEPKAKPQPTMGAAEGTMHMQSHEVKELLGDSERKRRAHLKWESGGQQGTHYLSEAPAALFGKDELCDVKVPKAPKHHVLVVNQEDGSCEVRNLHWWSSMKVRGRKVKKARLKDGDVAEVGGLKLTFVGDIG